jgi:PadR family transcriptional regulator PadR
MAKGTSNPDFLNGVPELMVLRVLQDESLHGYAIVQKISQRTGGKIEFGEGSIYPVLYRLEQEGLLTSRKEEVRGRQRVIYRLSSKGGKQLESRVARWQEIVCAIQTFFEGGENGLSPVATTAS